MGKEIRVKNYEPIALFPDYRQGWSDVWISWKVRPGRPLVRLAPTLISRHSVESDLKGAQWGVGHYAEGQPEHQAGVFSDITNADMLEHSIEEVEQYSALLSRLNHEGMFYEQHSQNPTQPTIYTPTPYVDRAEAERMVRFYLEAEHGIKNPKFRWARPEKSKSDGKRLIVTPAG